MLVGPGRLEIALTGAGIEKGRCRIYFMVDVREFVVLINKLPRAYIATQNEAMCIR
jgi:hypothetical protein